MSPSHVLSIVSTFGHSSHGDCLRYYVCVWYALTYRIMEFPLPAFMITDHGGKKRGKAIPVTGHEGP
jgi:hypothetical protein